MVKNKLFPKNPAILHKIQRMSIRVLFWWLDQMNDAFPALKTRFERGNNWLALPRI